jgi:hypothetical protein
MHLSLTKFKINDLKYPPLRQDVNLLHLNRDLEQLVLCSLLANVHMKNQKLDGQLKDGFRDMGSEDA